MSIKKAVIDTIDKIVAARTDEIDELLKLGRLVASGKHKFIAKLFPMRGSDGRWAFPMRNIGGRMQEISCVKKTLKSAITSVLNWYSDATFWEWPSKDLKSKKIEQGACGFRMHVSVCDEWGHNDIRVYDEKLWWHHVEAEVKRILRTQPTRKRSI